MTAGPQMPEWPHSNLLDIDPDFYEQRILDCWEARCRLAVELLSRMSEWDQFNPASNVGWMSGDHAHWKRQIDKAIAAVGPLEPEK